MFIHNAWYTAAWADEIADRPLGRRICNEPIVFFRDRQGRIAALEDRCCHRGSPLNLGTVVERGLQCGYHGLIYDRTGRCVHIPAQDRIPEAAKVRSYPVREKDQLVWVWIGDPDKSDDAKIVDFSYHNDCAAWPHKHDVMHVNAGYLLLADNLMDASHVVYVHAKTIGGDPQAFARPKEKLVRKPDGLVLTSWLLNSNPPPTYLKAIAFKGKVDRWLEREYIAPGTVLLWTGAIDAGTGAYESDRRDGGFSLRMFNGLTPETETSSFYFWSTANGYRQSEPGATEQVFADAKATFGEDKFVIEEQQKRLSEFGDAGMIDVATDTTRLYMRRVVERMLAERAAEKAAACR
jgi:phenylpropionate dioxygenase-like ring-hydroxylating dioxygenase large terminal subunit